MSGARVGVVPSIWAADLQGWLDSCAMVADLADAVFAPDHVRNGDRFEVATLSWPVLLSAAQQRFRLPVGPLVARCGAGQDEYVLHALGTLAGGGPLVVNLGVGDRVGRMEAVAAGLSWPDRAARVEVMAATAARCLARGWETHVASDRDEVHALMPAGCGAHVSPARDLVDGGRSIGRPVSVSHWSGAEGVAADGHAGHGHAWVCVEQFRGEDAGRFRRRVESVRGSLS